MGHERALTRRRLLIGAGVAAGAAATGSADAHRVDPPDNIPFEPGWIAGMLRSVDDPRTATVQRRNGVLATVQLLPDAEVLREGKAALSDFQIGDEVSAEGTQAGGIFIASRFEAVYQIFETKLRGRQRNGLQSSDGDLTLNEDSRPMKKGALGHRVSDRPLDGLSTARVIVSGRPQQSGDFLALRVGVIED